MKIHFQIDQIYITLIKKVFNYNLVVVFVNGLIIETNEGVHFKCLSPKLFYIPYITVHFLI